jgi:hypothetical protein
MSTSGEMGSTERVEWTLPNGDVVTIVVDRGKLCQAMAAKLTGHGAQKRATALFGAIVATRSRPASPLARREPIWMVQEVIRSNAGGKLYNAVKIATGEECDLYVPTYSKEAATNRVAYLNGRGYK